MLYAAAGHVVFGRGHVVCGRRTARFPEDAVCEGCIYLARGLKVAADRAWDDRLWKRVPRPDLPRVMESNYRTAIEEVSHIHGVSTFFSN